MVLWLQVCINVQFRSDLRVIFCGWMLLKGRKCGESAFKGQKCGYFVGDIVESMSISDLKARIVGRYHKK